MDMIREASQARLGRTRRRRRDWVNGGTITLADTPTEE